MTNNPPHWEQFALVLIDLQHDFWPESIAEHFPQFPSNTKNLLEFCRTEGIGIIHLRASFKADMSDWMPKYKLRGRIPCIEGTQGIEPLDFALERPDETVITKHSFDGFHNSELLNTLQQRGKHFVLVAGLITSTCVLFTATSAMQHGFLTAVIEDCCADYPAAHQQTLDHYEFIFDRVKVARLPERYFQWTKMLQKFFAIS